MTLEEYALGQNRPKEGNILLVIKLASMQSSFLASHYSEIAIGDFVQTTHPFIVS